MWETVELYAVVEISYVYVRGGLVGGPRAYKYQFRGFKSHRVHARRDVFGGCTKLSFSHDMPRHHFRQNILRHLPRIATEPSTDIYYGIPWDPNPSPNPNLGAVNIRVPRGLPCHSVDLPWSAVAVARVPLVACHGTPHGVP